MEKGKNPRRGGRLTCKNGRRKEGRKEGEGYVELKWKRSEMGKK
jgi:hypothetical protein